MPLYTYVCDECGATRTLLRRIDSRDDAVLCEREPADGGPGPLLMRRSLEMPAVHYKGFGFTRTPAVLSDPIAAGVNRQQRSDRINWGTQDGSGFGDGS